ncbi:MAG: putative glutamine amidotransferase protein [Rhizobium sp.]|nr:putative glutamine amidotransferase protein [Rhizobium sp.]
MRVLIVENMKNTPFGQMGFALTEAGAELDIRRVWNTDPLPENAGGHDAVVVFGGEQSALDDDTHPYLPSLAKLMRDFGEADKPVLGICLGSQLLARAYGAQNLLGQAPEFGWHHVQLTDAAGEDPVMSGIDRSFPIFEWHSDTFALPDRAVRLASNPAVENQCFRIGRASYGMQFHFEASRAVVEAWNRDFAEMIASKHPDWLPNYAEYADTHGPEADASGLAIARAWVSLVVPAYSAAVREMR